MTLDAHSSEGSLFGEWSCAQTLVLDADKVCFGAFHLAMRRRATRPRRVMAFQGNTSMLPPEEIDGLAEIDSMDPRAFAEAIVALRASSEICVVGGCCGTDERHLGAVANCVKR